MKIITHPIISEYTNNTNFIFDQYNDNNNNNEIDYNTSNKKILLILKKIFFLKNIFINIHG